jgi:hypothetical protein
MTMHIFSEVFPMLLLDANPLTQGGSKIKRL